VNASCLQELDTFSGVTQMILHKPNRKLFDHNASKCLSGHQKM